MTSSSSNDLLKLINSLSLAERLKIVEEILRTIREEGVDAKASESGKASGGAALLKFVGIMTEEEARVWDEALAESRKIDQDEW